MKEEKRTLISLVIGIWIIMVIISVIGCLFSASPLRFLFGEVVGSAIASVLCVHMYQTLDVALDLDEEHAKGHVKKGAFLRGMITVVLLFLAFYFHHWIHPIAVFLGAFGLKVAVYIRPLVEKLIVRIDKKGEM